MSWGNAFWFCAGGLVAAALAFVLPPLWRAALAQDRRRKALAIGAAATVAFAAISLLLYRHLGNPPQSASVVLSTGHPHAASMRVTSARASASLEEAARKLAARLQESGGTDAEWELLAQSYEYRGDAAAASEARAHRSAAALAAKSAQPADESAYRARLAGNPRDAAAWLAIAHLARKSRRFADAKEAYEHAIALRAMNADSWADYADMLASSSGSLRGAPGAAIAKALALDSKHTKALWLQASLAHEEQRYKDALSTWRALRALIADTSPDARIVDANIEEAAALAEPGAKTSAPAAAPVVVRGTSIDSASKAWLGISG